MLGFLTSKLGLGILAVVLLLSVFGVQALRLAHAKADTDRARAAVTLARADLKVCHDNTATLNASLDRQNAAAEADKADGDRMAAAVAKGRQATAAEAARADRNAAALGRAKAPGADQCAQLLAADAQVKELSR